MTAILNIVKWIIPALLFIAILNACKTGSTREQTLTDEQLMDLVQKQTFGYFWDGAEPTSGLARERYHVDEIYPQNDKNIVTSGGSGFGIMAIIAAIERGYITKEQGLNDLRK